MDRFEQVYRNSLTRVSHYGTLNSTTRAFVVGLLDDLFNVYCDTRQEHRGRPIKSEGHSGGQGNSQGVYQGQSHVLGPDGEPVLANTDPEHIQMEFNVNDVKQLLDDMTSREEGGSENNPPWSARTGRDGEEILGNEIVPYGEDEESAAARRRRNRYRDMSGSDSDSGSGSDSSDDSDDDSDESGSGSSDSDSESGSGIESASVSGSESEIDDNDRDKDYDPTKEKKATRYGSDGEEIEFDDIDNEDPLDPEYGAKKEKEKKKKKKTKSEKVSKESLKKKKIKLRTIKADRKSSKKKKDKKRRKRDTDDGDISDEYRRRTRKLKGRKGRCGRKRKSYDSVKQLKIKNYRCELTLPQRKLIYEYYKECKGNMEHTLIIRKLRNTIPELSRDHYYRIIAAGEMGRDLMNIDDIDARQHFPTIRHSDEVVDAVVEYARSDPSLSFKDISVRFGMSKSAVYRIVTRAKVSRNTKSFFDHNTRRSLKARSSMSGDDESREASCAVPVHERADIPEMRGLERQAYHSSGSDTEAEGDNQLPIIKKERIDDDENTEPAGGNQEVANNGEAAPSGASAVEAFMNNASAINNENQDSRSSGADRSVLKKVFFTPLTAVQKKAIYNYYLENRDKWGRIGCWNRVRHYRISRSNFYHIVKDGEAGKEFVDKPPRKTKNPELSVMRENKRIPKEKILELVKAAEENENMSYAELGAMFGISKTAANHHINKYYAKQEEEEARREFERTLGLSENWDAHQGTPAIEDGSAAPTTAGSLVPVDSNKWRSNKLTPPMRKAVYDFYRVNRHRSKDWILKKLTHLNLSKAALNSIIFDGNSGKLVSNKPSKMSTTRRGVRRGGGKVSQDMIDSLILTAKADATLTLKELAARFGMSRYSVHYYLSKAHIHRLTATDRRKIRLQLSGEVYTPYLDPSSKQKVLKYQSEYNRKKRALAKLGKTNASQEEIDKVIDEQMGRNHRKKTAGMRKAKKGQTSETSDAIQSISATTSSNNANMNMSMLMLDAHGNLTLGPPPPGGGLEFVPENTAGGSNNLTLLSGLQDDQSSAYQSQQQRAGVIGHSQQSRFMPTTTASGVATTHASSNALSQLYQQSTLTQQLLAPPAVPTTHTQFYSQFHNHQFYQQ